MGEVIDKRYTKRQVQLIAARRHLQLALGLVRNESTPWQHETMVAQPLACILDNVQYLLEREGV